MIRRRIGRTVWFCAVAVALPAAASAQQEGEAETAEDGGESRPDWDLPRVLIVAEKYVPDGLENNVRRMLKDVGEQVSTSEYVRAARSEGYPPTSFKAFSEVLPGLDVDLVVVVAGARLYGRRHLKLIYREGKGGLVLLEEIHPLAGLKLTSSVKQRILSEARLALSAVTRPKGDEGEPPGQGPGGDLQRERGSAVHVGLTAAAGAGTRAFEVPGRTGNVRLTTSPFPAAGLRLRVEVEPTAKGRIAYGGQLRYLTSIALRTTDETLGGEQTETASRSQELDLTLRLRWRAAEAEDAVVLGADLGYGFRLFSSEKPVTLPDFGLSGPLARLSVGIPLLEEGQLLLELAPEVQYYISIGGPLTDNGVDSKAIGVGGQAQVSYELTSALYLGALYREQHALMQADTGNAKDVSRFIMGQLVYRP